MRWKPNMKFAMPGVIALVLVSLLQDFIPHRLRIYVLGSIIITLALGLLTGQFRQMGIAHKRKQKPRNGQEQDNHPSE